MPHELTVGSLFAGIGGFDLGLERAGMRSVWQSEIDPYCQRVLAKHWPDVLRVPDVRDVGAGTVPYVDVICGGPPCQPTSYAGLGLGEADERWLWPDTLRIVGELRPRYAILENPPALLRRGMLGVLGGLADLGYDTEWSVVSAADVGAPHQRERVWIVAYVADADAERRDGRPRVFGPGWRTELEDRRRAVQDADGSAVLARWERGRAPQAGSAEWWAAEPPVGRVAYGVPARLDQLAALGNAVVPVIPELIGRQLLAYEAERELAA